MHLYHSLIYLATLFYQWIVLSITLKSYYAKKDKNYIAVHVLLCTKLKWLNINLFYACWKTEYTEEIRKENIRNNLWAKKIDKDPRSLLNIKIGKILKKKNLVRFCKATILSWFEKVHRIKTEGITKITKWKPERLWEGVK